MAPASSPLGLAPSVIFKAGCEFCLGPTVCQAPSHLSVFDSRSRCAMRLGLPFSCLPQFGLGWVDSVTEQDPS